MVKMPCNLAFLGKNKADEIRKQYDYDNWYLAGHSLGGAMAAAYAKEHGDGLSGLILLAAYPTGKLPEKPFSLLSIYGSEDGVLSMERVADGRTYWPQDSKEVCIAGGNHAQFGSYGAQSGDHAASITGEEQVKETVQAILDWIQEE